MCRFVNNAILREKFLGLYLHQADTREILPIPSQNNQHVARGMALENLIVTSQQIGIRKASLCFTWAQNIVFQCNITFLLMLSTSCVFHVFGCALFAYHLKSHINI